MLIAHFHVCFYIPLDCIQLLKPTHNIGKVSVNASILYKNQEIRNKANLWKFQLISLFLWRENSKKCIQHFCIHSNGRSFRLTRLIIGSYFTNYSKNDNTSGRNISRKAFYHRYLYIPCKLCVNLWTFFVFRSYQCCPGALTYKLTVHFHKRFILWLLTYASHSIVILGICNRMFPISRSHYCVVIGLHPWGYSLWEFLLPKNCTCAHPIFSCPTWKARYDAE